MKTFYRAGGLPIALIWLWAVPSIAQVSSDGSLPIPSNVSGCPNQCQITGGTTAGKNLFHSLKDFSVPAGQSVLFDSGPTIQRIFTRVTGGSSSQIDGEIQANADLFVINPAGIRFGAGARLNINGSFIVTTAQNIEFGPGQTFGLNSDILSVQAPKAFEVAPTSADIRINGNATPLTIIGDPRYSPTIGAGSSEGLAVAPGKTLGLIGNGIRVNRAALVAPSGHIELHSGTGKFGIQTDVQSARIQPIFSQPSNIQITQQSRIDASGALGSSIRISGDQVRLDHGSLILIQNQPGIGISPGIIQVNANNLTIQNAVGDYASRITSEHFGLAGANINIQTKQLNLHNTGQISTRSYGAGNSGRIDINSHSINLSNDDITNPSNVLNSIIVSDGLPPGSAAGAGPITIKAKSVNLRSGGAIVGERVKVNSDSITIDGNLPNGQPSAIFSSIDSVGHPGSVEIQAKHIQLSNSGTIGSITTTTERAADIILNADSIEISSTPTNRDVTAQRSFTGIASVAGSRRFNQIFAIPVTGQFGSSGNIYLNAKQLEVTRGSIATGNLGRGDAGQVIAQIGNIEIDRSIIYSGATIGNGGGIRVNSQLIKAFDSALLVNSDGVGTGGNIMIKADLIVSLNNLLTASSRGNQAGRVLVNAEQLLLDRQTQGVATSGLGADFDGEIVTRVNQTVPINPNYNHRSGLISPRIPVTCASQFGQTESFAQITQGGVIAHQAITPIGWRPEHPLASPTLSAVVSTTAEGWEIQTNDAEQRFVSFIKQPQPNSINTSPSAVTACSPK